MVRGMVMLLKKCQLGRDKQAPGLESENSSKFLALPRGGKVDSDNKANVGSVSKAVWETVSSHVLPQTPSPFRVSPTPL